MATGEWVMCDECGKREFSPVTGWRLVVPFRANFSPVSIICDTDYDKHFCSDACIAFHYSKSMNRGGGKAK